MVTSGYRPYSTRRPDGKTGGRRLLILDGHGSHLTSRFLAYCFSVSIDVVILPPHSSHRLQPLDVAVFGPLKRALAEKTDTLTRLDTGRISRVDWTTAYIRAGEQAITSQNILSGFRTTGLQPLSPITVLSTLEMPDNPGTPSRESRLDGNLDLTLLNSSPPDGTELREANTVLSRAVGGNATIETPVKRYISRATLALEKTVSENTLLRKENTEQRKLLETRKKRTKGKRVASDVGLSLIRKKSSMSSGKRRLKPGV